MVHQAADGTALFPVSSADEPYMDLAQIRAQQDEAEAAIERLTDMVEADPADVLAWQALIQILAREQRN